MNPHYYPTPLGNWMYQGMMFNTKGAMVYWIRENTSKTWREIADITPGGTIGNCQSAYRHYVRRIQSI